MAREQVVLPYEHQGQGKEVRIYDGRQSMLQRGGHWGKHSMLKPLESSEGFDEAAAQAEPGTIHYVRDSDDEAPDSDEDPDDDLDI